jgi:pyruvate dehydrogenase E2 component (dihydrolipoamide acetyltransferase)
MAVERVIMPKLGAYTEDVVLTEWRVAEGEQVDAGAVVLEMETDKTTADVVAETSGWVHRLVREGASVAIGTVVGLVASSIEEYEALVAEAKAVAADVVDEDAHPFLGYIGHGGGAAVQTARAGDGAPLAPTKGAPTPAVDGDAGPARDALLVSPRARALLETLGHPLEVARQILGSGPGGRILDRDVAAWDEARNAGLAEAAASGDDGAVPEPRVAERIPLRGRRGTIAARMVSSLQTSAQLTSVVELDVKPLVDFRRQLNDAGASSPIGITAIVVKLAAAALRSHPLLNARVTETDIEILADVNVAVAVETPDGLVAPVVHRADTLGLDEIDARIADLAARARDGSLRIDDVSGGTFTVSNGGIHPVDITTAILNPPQVGILWIGRIRDRPVVDTDGAVVVRPTVQTCLTFDHRAVDGGPAAAFLGTLEKLVAALPELPR